MLFNKNLSDQLDKKPGLKPNKKATGQVVHFNKMKYDDAKAPITQRIPSNKMESETDTVH